MDAFSIGVAAADPEISLRNSLIKNPLLNIGTDGKYIIVSVGKAACKMADCAINHLPQNTKFSAIAVTNFENVVDVPNCQVMGASHPIPCEHGLLAAQTVISRLEHATINDVVIMLVSGGASALLPAPVPEINLTDKIQLNKILLSSGFDIAQMNLVRQSVSRLKGGGALGFAAPATVHSYILSDVIGDDLSVVASGPSIAPLGTATDAKNLLINQGIFPKLPPRIQNYLQTTPAPISPFPLVNAHLIAGNSNSVRAMAKAVDATVISTPLVGDVQDAAERVIATARSLYKAEPFAIAFGGETTVKLTGNGKGGRNQELALRVAILAKTAFPDRVWCFLSGGTDGIDGPTDAAGGLVDAGTLDRLQKAGQNADNVLVDNDSYNALKLSGDLVITGATGTNVADLQLLIIGS